MRGRPCVPSASTRSVCRPDVDHVLAQTRRRWLWPPRRRSTTATRSAIDDDARLATTGAGRRHDGDAAAREAERGAGTLADGGATGTAGCGRLPPCPPLTRERHVPGLDEAAPHDRCGLPDAVIAGAIDRPYPEADVRRGAHLEADTGGADARQANRLPHATTSTPLQLVAREAAATRVTTVPRDACDAADPAAARRRTPRVGC